MTLPNTFANETSPNMQELDENFLAVANMAIWKTVATGTNAVTLTPSADQPAVAAYTNNQKFAFTAANNSSGSVTLQVNAIGLLPLYKSDGTQAGSGTLASGSYYEIVYLSALNSGAGGFLIVSAVPASVVAPLSLGMARGLLVTNNAAVPSTKIDITANQALLVTSGGTPLFLGGGTAPSVTIDLTTTGANGMDTGARPTSGWVYCYLISTGSVTAGLATATSPTAGSPTMPGGYSYLLYVGAMYCDASQNLKRSRQQGRDAQYVVTAATNTASMVLIQSSAAGSVTVPTYTNTGLGAIVPATASRLRGTMSSQGAGAGIFIIAPNATGYGNVSSSTNAPLAGFQAITAVTQGLAQFDMGLESQTIYYAMTASSQLYASGWQDSYVNA